MSKRIRTVYPSDMVAHVWAQQTQAEARAQSGGNIFFEGPTLYSYRTSYPIATFINVPTKAAARGATGYVQRIALLTADTYSVTTSRHQRMARDASRQYPQVELPLKAIAFASDMPNVGNWTNDFRDTFVRLCAEHFAQSRDENANKAARARTNTEWLLGQANAFAKSANDLADALEPAFGKRAVKPLRLAPIASDTLAARAKAQREASKIASAERKARELQHAREEAEALMRAVDAFCAWRRGEESRGNSSIPYVHRIAMPYMLAARGEVVRSSGGADVPTAHVKRALPLALDLLRIAEAQSDGAAVGAESMRGRELGHFTINGAQSRNGITYLRVGCHEFTYAEVVRLAKIIRPELALPASAPAPAPMVPDELATYLAEVGLCYQPLPRDII